MLLKDKIKDSFKAEWVVRGMITLCVFGFIVFIFLHSENELAKAKEIYTEKYSPREALNVKEEVNTIVVKSSQTVGPRMTRDYNTEFDRDIVNSMYKFCDKIYLKLHISATDPILATTTEVTHMIENIGNDGKDCNYHLTFMDKTDERGSR